MRTAHIVTRPHGVGDRVLALCGKKHKVKTLWGDIPDGTPICRDCVDRLVHAVDEADSLITRSRMHVRRLAAYMTLLHETVNPEDGLELDEIADEATAYVVSREARKKAKRTCTCEWDDKYNRIEDEDCPVHRLPSQPPPDDSQKAAEETTN